MEMVEKGWGQVLGGEKGYKVRFASVWLRHFRTTSCRVLFCFKEVS